MAQGIAGQAQPSWAVQIRRLLALSALVAPGGIALAAPMDGAVGESQSVDQTRYFATPEEELSSRAAVKRRFDLIEDKDKALDNEATFHALESLFGDCLDHYAYFELIASRNAGDLPASAARDDVEGLCGDIASAAKDQVRAALSVEHWAEPYAYLAVRSARAAAHPLPVEAKPLAAAVDTALDHFEHVHRVAMQGAGFPTVRNGQVTLKVSDDFHTLMALPDEALRRRAWTLHHNAMLQRKPALADALIGIASLRDGLAVSRGYADATEQAYAGMGLDREDVDTAIHALQAHASSYAAYLSMTAIDPSGDASPWNAEAAAAGYTPVAVPMEDVRQTAMRAVARLGEEHVTQMGAVLDPLGGRMDFASELGGRKRDAFSITAPHSTSVLYVGHRRGDTESDVEVVHEGAHAVHGQLMNEHGTSPLFRHGASWLEETFAILDEFLYREQLVADARTVEAREYFQKGLLRDMALQLFVSAEEAGLEAAIHRGVHDGTVRGPDDLDALVVQMRTLHEGSFHGQPGQDTTWAGKRLFYQDPLYLTNYLLAGLVAVKLYALSSDDPGFAERYAKVQARGFDREPRQVVEELLGAPVDWTRMANDDVAIFDARVSSLRSR